MSINYKIVQAGGTSTDLNVSVEGLNLVFEMKEYKSGVHYLNRSGEGIVEKVTLPSLTIKAKVTIYLEDSPETIKQEDGITVTKNEGMFVIDVCRQGIDTPYIPENLVMYVGEFELPAGTTDLNDCKINIVKVV